MRRNFLLSAILFALPLLAADPGLDLVKEQIGAQVRLGDIAMEKGDFGNAADYYASALKRSDSDFRLRGDIMLKLARAQLYGGNAALAAELMGKFQADYPERSAGLLPGEILQKTGKKEEAGSFFSNLFKSSGDSVDKSEILYRLAEVAIAEGDYTRAEECFDDIVKNGDPLWSAQAKLSKVFIMIKKGNISDAGKLLDAFDADGKIPAGGEFRSKSLRLLLTAKIGDAAKFLSLWADFSKLYAPVGDPVVAEALGEVAQHLVKAGKNSEAEALLSDSFLWQVLDSERQDVLRTIFALQSVDVGKAESAADTAKRYSELFPQADDRIDMIFFAAGKLYLAGSLDRALKLFSQVSADQVTPEKLATRSRRNSALIAEQLGKKDLAKDIYLELLKRGKGAELKSDQLNFGAFLYRAGEYDEAIRILEKISGDEKAAMLLTDAAVKAGDLAKARQVAAELSRSKDLESVGFGMFHLAELSETEGDFSGARTAYLQYVKRFGKEGFYSDIAGFRAALLAWKSGSDDRALELEEFARLNPGSANSPLALLVAMQSKPTLADARAVFASLQGKYPNSPELKQAVLQLAGHMIQEGERDGFFVLLDENEKLFTETNELADLGFVRLRGIYKFNGPAAASSLGNELIEKYPSADIAPEIAFFCGGIEAELKQYEKARECYRRAAELCPAGRLYCCAKGREADMDLAIFVSGVDASALERAENIYRELREKTLTSYADIEQESIFKAGYCRELSGKKLEAVKLYEEVLHVASNLQKQGIAPQEVWCVQALCRTVRILTEIRPAGYIGRAVRDINLVRELNLTNTGEDFEKMIKEVREMVKSVKK